MRLVTDDPFDQEDFPNLLSKKAVDQYIQKFRAKLSAELDVYAAYLCFRVQRDLYEVLTEEGLFRNLPWEALILQLEWNEDLRTATSFVLLYGIFLLSESDYFDTPPISPDDDFLNNEPDILRGARLFSDESGRKVIQLLMLRVQYFQKLRQDQQETRQSWKEFLKDLSTNEAVWQEFLRGFRHALRYLDFKPLWRQRELKSLFADE